MKKSFVLLGFLLFVSNAFALEVLCTAQWSSNDGFAFVIRGNVPDVEKSVSVYSYDGKLLPGKLENLNVFFPKVDFADLTNYNVGTAEGYVEWFRNVSGEGLANVRGRYTFTDKEKRLYTVSVFALLTAAGQMIERDTKFIGQGRVIAHMQGGGQITTQMNMAQFVCSNLTNFKFSELKL